MKNVPPCATRPELKFSIRPSSCKVTPFKHRQRRRRAGVVQEQHILRVPRAADRQIADGHRVRKIDWRRWIDGNGFPAGVVIITDCELPGGTPSDQADGLSQLPLVGLVQALMSVLAKIGEQVQNSTKTNPRMIFIKWSFSGWKTSSALRTINGKRPT